MSSTHAHFLGSDKFLMCMLGAPGVVFFLLDCVLDHLALEGALEMLFPQSDFGLLLLQLCPHSQSHQLCPPQKSLLPLGLFLPVSISEHLVLWFSLSSLLLFDDPWPLQHNMGLGHREGPSLFFSALAKLCPQLQCCVAWHRTFCLCRFSVLLLLTCHDF